MAKVGIEPVEGDIICKTYFDGLKRHYLILDCVPIVNKYIIKCLDIDEGDMLWIEIKDEDRDIYKVEII